MQTIVDLKVLECIHIPSDDLLKTVGVALILRGSSLSAWAKETGVRRQNLTKAITGEWQGPKARELVDHAVETLFGDDQL